MKVLLVDDTRTLLSLIQVYLMGWQIEFVEAKDGIEGLARAREHRPDLVISDVRMPGMDGFELCAAIRADRVAARDAASSSSPRSNDDASRKKGKLVGATAFLTKPVSVEELRKTVGRHPAPPGEEVARGGLAGHRRRPRGAPRRPGALSRAVVPRSAGAVLEARARAIAAARETAARRDRLRSLAFGVGGERYAVAVEEVFEILEARGLSPLPAAPPWLLGALVARTRVVPVLDLRQLLGLEGGGMSDLAKIVVVEHGGEAFGLAAEVVEGQVEVPREGLSPAAERAVRVDRAGPAGAARSREARRPRGARRVAHGTRDPPTDLAHLLRGGARAPRGHQRGHPRARARSRRGAGVLDGVRRTAHSLKGSAGSLGLADVETLAHAIEGSLAGFDPAAGLSRAAVQAALDAVEAIEEALAAGDAGGEVASARVEALLGGARRRRCPRRPRGARRPRAGPARGDDGGDRRASAPRAEVGAAADMDALEAAVEQLCAPLDPDTRRARRDGGAARAAAPARRARAIRRRRGSRSPERPTRSPLLADGGPDAPRGHRGARRRPHRPARRARARGGSGA